MRTFLLWLAVAAAPLAWALQLVVGSGYEELACARAGRSSSELFLAVLTVVLAAVAGSGATAGYVMWRDVRRGAIDDPRGRVSFLAFAALVASALFLATIVLGGLGLVGLGSCET